MTRQNKRILLVPFGAVSVVLLAAATAFACTAFNGTFTVTSSGVTGASGSVTATGTDAQGAPAMTQTINTGANAQAPRAGGATLTLSTGTAPNGSFLTNGTYDVNYYKGSTAADGPLPAYEGDQWVVDCMSPTAAAAGTSKLGTVTVSGGAISGANTFTQPAAGASGTRQAAVCISSSLGERGNEVPLTIV